MVKCLTKLRKPYLPHCDSNAFGYSAQFLLTGYQIPGHRGIEKTAIVLHPTSYLTEQEYKRLLRTVQKNASRYFKLRDTAVITMFLGMGLRLSELVGLNVGSVNSEDGTIKVSRKGNQEHILPVNEDVMISVQRYLKTRQETAFSSPLFLSKRNQRIDSGSVWYLVKKYLQQAQIEKDKLSPHTLRHTFATTFLKQGENILTIKELLSHRNLRTTERYLHINGEDLKTAVGRMDLTFR